jgi:hypothetical protein
VVGWWCLQNFDYFCKTTRGWHKQKTPYHLHKGTGVPSRPMVRATHVRTAHQGFLDNVVQIHMNMCDKRCHNDAFSGKTGRNGATQLPLNGGGCSPRTKPAGLVPREVVENWIKKRLANTSKQPKANSRIEPNSNAALSSWNVLSPVIATHYTQLPVSSS